MQIVIQALAGIHGVVGVGLGGSRGMGLAKETSDYDFVIFRLGGEPVAPALIVSAFKPLADVGSIVDTAGFVRARFGGIKVDVFQKDMYQIEQEINAAKQGRVNWLIRPLFPHGDLSTCLISHVEHLQICAEKNGLLNQLKKMAQPYPLPLQQSMIDTFLTQCSNVTIHVSKIHGPEERQQMLALCSAFFFYANILLFALNKKYPVLEKGARTLLAGLALQPFAYTDRMQSIMQAVLDGNIHHVHSEQSKMLKELEALSTQALDRLKTLSSV